MDLSETSAIERLRSDISLDVFLNTTRPVSVDIQLKFYAIFSTIFGILIILFNSAIVVSSGLIIHRGQQPRSTYIFLGNVALSDFLIGCFVLFNEYCPIEHRTETICAVQLGMVVSSSITSVYSVGLIAIDRYLYILYGLQYGRYIYPNRARAMTFMTWILGLIIGFLPAMGIRGDTNGGEFCWFVLLTPPTLILVTTTIGIIPLVVIIVLYSIILREALKKIGELRSAAANHKGTNSGSLRLFRGGTQQNESINNPLNTVQTDQMKNPANELSSSSPSTSFFKLRKFLNFFKRSSRRNQITITPVYNPSKWRAIKIVLLTTGSYFITWGPFFIASTMFAVCDPAATPILCDNLKVAIGSPLAILGLLNSVLNPIIYAWWHNGFRESVKKIYNGVICNRLSRNFNDFSTSKSSNKTQTTLANRISCGSNSSSCGGGNFHKQQVPNSPVKISKSPTLNQTFHMGVRAKVLESIDSESSA